MSARRIGVLVAVLIAVIGALSVYAGLQARDVLVDLALFGVVLLPIAVALLSSIRRGQTQLRVCLPPLLAAITVAIVMQTILVVEAVSTRQGVFAALTLLLFLAVWVASFLSLRARPRPRPGRRTPGPGAAGDRR